MKKVVIAGSAKLQKEINKWLKIFESKNYEILDYPREIEQERFIELYPSIHKTFFECITKTDMLFIMNEDKRCQVKMFNVMKKLIYGYNLDG